MNTGRYIFSQMTDFLPKRKFERMISERIKSGITDPTLGWQLSYWNQLLVLMFGQLDGCRSLREFIDIVTAHKEKSFHLGFGKGGINRSALSRCNAYRDWRIFEEFAYYMMNLAQNARIGREFCMKGRFYAFDSSTIDLCMSVFKWANFRSTKAGIKLHTQLDVVTQIPKMVCITEARLHDVNAMDIIEYERYAGYIFDRGYWDLNRLYHINQLDAFFVIREKRRPEYKVESGIDFDDKSNVLRDESVRFTGKRNLMNYPGIIRRIVAYIPELNRTFTFYTNNFILSA